MGDDTIPLWMLEDIPVSISDEIPLSISDEPLLSTSYELPLSLSVEEFERWVPIPDALAVLDKHWTPHVSRETLWRYLQLGKLVARAESMVFRGTDVAFAQIPEALWKSEPPEYTSFWLNGMYETFARDLNEQQVLVTFFRVRVDPAGLARMVPQPAVVRTRESEPSKRKPPKSKPPKQEKPVVPRADLARWHEVFRQVHPHASEALAMRSATAMFPDHHIPRQNVRDLRGPQRVKKSSNHGERRRIGGELDGIVDGMFRIDNDRH
jgi:hypothetical protein